MTDFVRAPIQCPLCLALAGKPFKQAYHDPNNRRILLRCENCGHRWSEIEPLSPLPGEPARRSIG